MENLTHLLDLNQSLFVEYSTYHRLIEDLILNQSQFKDESNIEIFFSRLVQFPDY